jgi:type I restriction enzyme M protein
MFYLERKMIEYQKGDIVRLGDSEFDELKGQLWFKDNAFEIYKVVPDGMVSLMELDEQIPASHLQFMPINKKYAGCIYYDPIIAASVVGPDDEIPVHNTDYSYFMESFGRVIEDDGSTLLDHVGEQKFKYVHEVQHWLREQYGSDDLRIHHKLITQAEAQFRNIWNLRDSLLDAGVSSYQFLFEMANMLYLRWLAFNNDNAFEQWKELEQTTGDELLLKYHKAIQQIKQQTRIYSGKTLEKAIDEVSKCAKQENLAELFDLMIDENSKMMDCGSAQNSSPRILARLLVELMQPKIGERWHDPAAGFSGFLVELDRYLKKEYVDYQLQSQKEKAFQLTEALSGMEIQKEIARIGFCHTRFHGLRCKIETGDSLAIKDTQQYDGIICEPPMPVFSLAGKQKDGNKNRQLEFVEKILKSLHRQSESRAALLLPESFLNKTSFDYSNIRKRLFEEYDTHTILRLPKGIYPNSSISVCAVFIRTGRNQDRILVYDMQAKNLKPKQGIGMFDGFMKAYREGMLDQSSRYCSLREIREDGFKIAFEKDNPQEDKTEKPTHYLLEANKVVNEIRSLLRKIEKEIDD